MKFLNNLKTFFSGIFGNSSKSSAKKIGRTGVSTSGEVNERLVRQLAEKEQKEKEKILEKQKKQNGGQKGLFVKLMRRVFTSEYVEDQPEEIYRSKGSIDRPMLVLILALTCIGCLTVFSASYAYAESKTGDSYFYIKKQLIYCFVGVVFMIGISFLDYRWMRKFTPYGFAVGCVLLVLVLVMGVASGAAQRWLQLGSLSFQPSETMKLGLVMMLAWYFSLDKVERKVGTGRPRTDIYGTIIPLIIVGMVCALVMMEKHLSGTIILFVIGIIVIFAAGGRWWILAAIVGLFGTAVILMIKFELIGYITERWELWLHPENFSEQDEAWQTLQSLYAVGSGGIFGVGFGQSIQKHLFVSQPQNDFIFSIFCEELGMVGAVAVIVLFLIFVWRGIVIARRAPDTFSRLTALGIVSKVGLQALLNIAVVTNAIPNTGVSLPFFSYGGTALLILFAEMGVLLSISRYSYLKVK